MHLGNEEGHREPETLSEFLTILWAGRLALIIRGSQV